MKTSISNLAKIVLACSLIQNACASEAFDMKTAVRELKSESCDLRSLYERLDEYQKNASNPEDRFDAQQLLLHVTVKINDEYLDRETWEGDMIPSRGVEFCHETLEKSQNQWHRVFAFLGLTGEYIGYRKDLELAIPLLTNAIAQIESLELNPAELSPALAYLNELCVAGDGRDWYKRIFSGELGEVYVQLNRLDEAERIRKNIRSQYWEETLDWSIQNHKRVIHAREDSKRRQDNRYVSLPVNASGDRTIKGHPTKNGGNRPSKKSEAPANATLALKDMRFPAMSDFMSMLLILCFFATLWFMCRKHK